MNRPVGLEPLQPLHDTKNRLIQTGLRLMLERGYNATGMQEILTESAVPRGSFYHHFATKEEFAIQLLDAYAGGVRRLMETTLLDSDRPPLDRVRSFFAGVRQAYETEGYLGCFLGALGQELSGTSDLFRRKIAECLATITDNIASCLAEARTRGQLPAETDTTRMAEVLVDTWEGAALRSRLARSSRPLEGVIDFYLRTAIRR